MSLYLTTSDAEVLATLERNAAAFQEFCERAHSWGEERGSDTVMMSGWGNHRYVTGLPEQPDPGKFGRWTKPRRGGNSRPFKDNIGERQALAALKYESTPIPGLPEEVSSKDNPTGRFWIMWPVPFAHDGAAWVEYQHQPDPADLAKIDMTIWSECLGSAFQAAREAREAVDEAAR